MNISENVRYCDGCTVLRLQSNMSQPCFLCFETLLQYQWVVGPCNVFSIPDGFDRVVQCASGTLSFPFNTITKIRKMSMKALGLDNFFGVQKEDKQFDE